MQAYHPNGNPPYYPPQYLPPGGYYTPYGAPPALYPQQNAQAFPGVYPGEYPEAEEHARAAKARYPLTPHIRPKYLNRSQSTQVRSQQQQPPKSIMKKRNDRSASMGVMDPEISRSRSNSNPRPPSRGNASGEGPRPPSRSTSTRQRANSSTRPQFDPNPPFAPDHLFVSLHSTNEIRVEGIAWHALVEELREHFLVLWPHGVSSESSYQDKWRAQFSGNPWTSSGTDLTFARRMLTGLWAVLSGNNYSYIATVNTSTASSRLVFALNQNFSQKEYANYFMVIVSPSGDKVSLVDAPQELLAPLDTRIRAVFPRKIASNRYTEDGVYKIALRKSFGSGSDVDKGHFTGFILMFLREYGFQLNGSVSIGRSRSPLAFGAKKEMWILKSVRPMRPASSNGH